MKDAGIYIIIRQGICENYYIGSSTNVERRIYEHKRYLERGQHSNIRLQRLHDLGEKLHYIKYISVVDDVSISELRLLEKQIITEYITQHGDRVLNMSMNTVCSMDDPDVKAKAILHRKIWLDNPINRAYHSKCATDANNRPEIKAAFVNRVKQRFKNPDIVKEYSDRMNARFTPEYQSNLIEASVAACSIAVVCIETSVRFSSMSAAIIWLNSIGFDRATASSISEACCLAIPSAYGYSWTYENATQKQLTKLHKNLDKYRAQYAKDVVTCINLGIIFEDVGKAVDWLCSRGIYAKRAVIVGACAGRKKSAYGFKWCYTFR